MLLNKRIPITYIFSLIKYKLIFVVLIAGFISHFDGEFESWGISFPIVPDWMPGMLGMLITLILAFRLNQSYERWWEGRKIWGGIVNDSRSLIREVANLTQKNVDEKAHKIFQVHVMNLLVLWLRSFKTKLRGLPIEDYVSESKRLDVGESVHLPNAILMKIEGLIRQAYFDAIINEYQQLQITNTVNKLSDGMGKCERIKGTVFPKMFTDTIDFIIWFFIIVFPLAFRDPNHYVEFPVVVVVSMIFVFLEKLAIEIQNPFENKPTDVPLDAIVFGIESFVFETIDKKDQVLEIEKHDFYQM